MEKDGAIRLNNLIFYEFEVFRNVFGPYFDKNKAEVIFKTFKINAGRELIEPSQKTIEGVIPSESISVFPEDQTISKYIYQLRSLGVSDDNTYNQIKLSRDCFLNERGWNGLGYSMLLNKRQIVQIYDSVLDGLKSMEELKFLKVAG